MSITDSNIRAAVWPGLNVWGDPGDGTRWYVDVYYARRRSRAASVFGRATMDGDPTAAVIRRDFDDRRAALLYAESTVGIMRGAAALAIAAGAASVSTAEALTRVQALTRVLCDDPAGPTMEGTTDE